MLDALIYGLGLGARSRYETSACSIANWFLGGLLPFDPPLPYPPTLESAKLFATYGQPFPDQTTAIRRYPFIVDYLHACHRDGMDVAAAGFQLAHRIVVRHLTAISDAERSALKAEIESNRFDRSAAITLSAFLSFTEMAIEPDRERGVAPEILRAVHLVRRSVDSVVLDLTRQDVVQILAGNLDPAARQAERFLGNTIDLLGLREETVNALGGPQAIRRILQAGSGKNDPRLPDDTTRVRAKLTYNEPLDQADVMLLSAIRGQVTAYLDQWRASHLQIFRDRLTQLQPQLPTAALLQTEIESLASSIASWDTRLIPEIHDVVTKGRDDWEGDVLAVFFNSANASNYDALITEESIRAATATFDDAVAIAQTFYPSITTEELSQFELTWLLSIVGMNERWKTMHRVRFNEILGSWASHQHAASLTGAFTAMCRAHFQGEARYAVRRYRQTLLPVVTTVFAETPQLDALRAVDQETLGTLRTMAFDGFPVKDAWEDAPQLARAYLLAWLDLSRVVDETLAKALKQGREDCASEIQLTDCEEQFANLGEAALNAEFQPLFDDVRAFYVRRMSG
jgi:hypothetical protein